MVLSHTWLCDLVYCRVHTDMGKGTMAKPVAGLLDLASGSTASSLEGDHEWSFPPHPPAGETQEVPLHPGLEYLLRLNGDVSTEMYMYVSILMY